jgi:Domain of unknown function (DUF4835)
MQTGNKTIPFILAFFATVLFQSNKIIAQELNAKIIVNASAVQNSTDIKIFKTLEQGLQDFLNKRKWTLDEYTMDEKIECQFNLTIIKKGKDADCYDAKLSVQAARPVFQTDYVSPILNYVDKDIYFKYIQFQPLDFNENRVAGNDPSIGNLPAIMAYYVNYIIGLDYDSYKLKGGSEYFAKVMAIVNNAPEGSGITGWKNEGAKNRYWLADNMLSARFVNFREVMYTYHRNGLDAMAKNPPEALDVILESIKTLSQLNMETPSSALLFLYFSTKNNEYYNFLSKASTEDKQKLIPLISMLDVPNATKYSGLLR